jgi:hypothetical protein
VFLTLKVKICRLQRIKSWCFNAIQRGHWQALSSPFVKDGKPLVSKIEAAENAKMGILKAVDAIGGFGSTINEGDKVLVKPNFNSAGILPVSTESEWVSKVFSVSLFPVFL